MKNLTSAFVVLTLFGSVFASASDERVRTGLQVLFDFNDVTGGRIRDESGANRPIELKIETPKTVVAKPGWIEIRGKAVIRSVSRADKIHRASEWTNEITVETWIEPANATQNGPARIVTYSRNGSQRNFTLGQEGNKFDFRLRTNRTSANGIPSVSTTSGSARAKPTHVVYSRRKDGQACFYVDGKLITQKNVPGEFNNWDINFRLLIGNEQSDDRVWQGKVYLVAIYNRALSPSEVRQNHLAGADAKTPPRVVSQSSDSFRLQVAPIIARHCIECHDSFNRKGDLDLSRKATAELGGDSGKIFHSKNPREGLFWEMIESDEMPPDRPPLKAAEKDAIRKWLDAGGKWTVDSIDPAVFLRSREVEESLVRRLTVQEYIDSVQMAVGVDIQKQARDLLPKDLRADGFANTAYNLNVDLKHIQIFSKLASEIAGQVKVKELVKTFYSKPLDSKGFSDKDLNQLVSKLGRWILRGTLNEIESQSLIEVAKTTRESGGSFEDAVRATLQVMLQSPRFLYQMEQQRGDGTRWPVDTFTLANRTSFILWGCPPDRELFELASTRVLRDPKIFASQIDRMLDHPRARDRSIEFLVQWLNLERLKSMKPNADKFPKWNGSIAEQMRIETTRFWTEIVWNRKEPLSALFDSDVTFLTSELAKHYGVPVANLGKEDEAKGGWHRVDLSKVAGRRGILTHGSVLTVGGDEASMVARGLFVLDDVLRGVVNDPPACVDTTPTPTQAGLSQRLIALKRIKDKNCGGCHKRFEPLAFGFERFDGLGRYHEKDEHGNKLREDGEIRIPGESKVHQYQSTQELVKLLASSDRTTETMIWKLTQFSIGRPLGANDVETVGEIIDRSVSSGGTYQSTMRAILQSKFVQTTKTEPYPEVSR